MDQPDHVIALRAVAARHDLAGLRAEVDELLTFVLEEERPFVATSLVEALKRFEDSYGEPAAKN